VAGIQNFPTVGLIDGNLRHALEETGMGYDAEIQLVRDAHALGFLTSPYVFDATQARAMAEAGADIVVAHMGLTTGGAIGLKTGAKSLDECVALCREIYDAARAVRQDALVLVHGGPLEGSEEADYVLKRIPGVAGFYGASSVERLPVEKAIKSTVEGLKGLAVTKPEG
jgi:predicted TIM-barrel enzyme